MQCLNSEFSFSEIDYLTKAKETSLSYYLPIAGFMSFLKALAWTASSRVWTWVIDSIFNNF